MEFNPWPGKIPQATELLSPHSRAQELQLRNPALHLPKPAHLEPVPYNMRSRRNERPTHRNKRTEAPAHCNLRRPLQSNKDPVQPKMKIKLKEKKNTKCKEGVNELVSVVLILLHLLNKNLPHSEVP